MGKLEENAPTRLLKSAFTEYCGVLLSSFPDLLTYKMKNDLHDVFLSTVNKYKHYKKKREKEHRNLQNKGLFFEMGIRR